MKNRAPERRPVTRSDFKILDFENSQYESICKLHNLVHRDYPQSLDEFAHDDQAVVKNGYFLNRLVAIRGGKRVVGYGGIMERVETYIPKTLYVEVVVDPRRTDSSHWESLYRKLEDRAKSRGTKVLKAIVSELDSFGKESWRGVGFEEKSASVESRLDLRKLGRDELSRQLRLFGERVITFSNLAQERRRNSKHEAEIYDMEKSAGADVPATDRWRPMTRSEYHNLVFASPSVVPTAWFIARDGPQYVGESCLLRNRLWPHHSIGTGFTCVLRDYRGRGIARHLKIMALRWAKDRGFDHIRTWNDSENDPMLNLNRELGFEKHALWLRLEKHLR